MAVIKCKMCGGDLRIVAGSSVAECEYCGTRQTLPKLDDERKANLYDRANHFRRNNEFDKAMGIYEQILSEDKTDADVYWSLVLCRYGIEYVEDPRTHKRIPTVNRAQFKSILSDEDYLSALQYADASQREVYEEEANTIDKIQKGILSISQTEEPYDVFICYKETDNNGRRTADSVLAQDLYKELTDEGLKVFFSRITLEDKLGTAYEPYIFAALNSAKVMVVLGTKPEHFNAVWVKNEWSRYLALIRGGAKKTLIPAYRDMDPYDLPEEFSHLQAQDMSKLGFMQDLVRGVKKIAGAEKKVVVETVKSTVDTAALLKRVQMFMEDSDWINAEKYCERILDMEPTNASAYLHKLLVSLHITKTEDLAKCQKSFAQDGNYQKALRYADSTLKTQLESYLVAAENNRQAEKTQRAKSNGKLKVILAALIITAGIGAGAYYGLVLKPQKDFEAAHTMLMSGQVEEAYTKLQTMREETELQDILYQAAVQLVEQKQYDSAEQIIGKLGEYEGVKELNSDINFGRAQEAFDSKEYDRTLTLLRKSSSEGVDSLKMEAQYMKGKQYYDDGKYSEAITQLTPLEGYKDSASMITQATFLSMPEQVRNMQVRNSDTVGWLYIPDTDINNAVVQDESNDTLYRRTNELGDNNIHGSYFADYECNFGTHANDLFRSTVIYGMNNYAGQGDRTFEVYKAYGVTAIPDDPNGQRFAQLFKFADIEWAKTHPYIYFSTPQEVLKWEVFCVAYTNDFNYINILSNRSAGTQITATQMLNIVNTQRNHSEYDYDVEVNADDKIITLSTNTYKYGRRDDDLRFIVMAKLVTDDDPVVAQATISINTDKIEVK